MTAIDIDAIRQREQAATEGPWWADDSEQTWRLHGVAFRMPAPWEGAPEQVMNKQILKAPKASDQFEPYWPDAADAEFIAHARTDVPALLAEVDRLRAALARTQETHEPDRPSMVAPNGCDDCSVEPFEHHRYPHCPGRERARTQETQP